MKTPLQRLWSKVEITETCWLWKAGLTGDGYGSIRVGDKVKGTHLFLFEQLMGAIPEGLELDHLCRVRNCVRPDHLEAVTHGENMKRSANGQHFIPPVQCPHGHEYTPENTRIYKRPGGGINRKCVECARRSGRETKRKKRERDRAAASS